VYCALRYEPSQHWHSVANLAYVVARCLWHVPVRIQVVSFVSLFTSLVLFPFYLVFILYFFIVICDLFRLTFILFIICTCLSYESRIWKLKISFWQTTLWLCRHVFRCTCRSQSVTRTPCSGNCSLGSVSIFLNIFFCKRVIASWNSLRGVYSDTTQLNSTELNWPSWTAYSQVSRVFVYDVTTYKLSQLLFTLSSWVQLSWVVSL